jgi:hypothetical protein
MTIPEVILSQKFESNRQNSNPFDPPSKYIQQSPFLLNGLTVSTYITEE